MIRFELLPNGLYRAFNYRTRTSGLYTSFGQYKSGDLRLSAYEVMRGIQNQNANK